MLGICRSAWEEIGSPRTVLAGEHRSLSQQTETAHFRAGCKSVDGFLGGGDSTVRL